MSESTYDQHLQRRRELIREAKIQRLLSEARADTPRLQQRFLVLLSDLMISSGERLKRRAGLSRWNPRRTFDDGDQMLELVTRR